jgi:hypothetical protein
LGRCHDRQKAGNPEQGDFQDRKIIQQESADTYLPAEFSDQVRMNRRVNR